MSRRSAPPRGMSLSQQATSLPNLVTYVRILAIPGVMVFMGFDSPQNAFIAAMIFAVASASDALDGYLARRFQLISVVGKFLDPLADKLIVMGALLMLLSLGRVHVAVVAIILAREMTVSGLRAVAASEGLVIAARDLGKKKTAFQMVGLWALILHHPYPLLSTTINWHRIGSVLLYISIAFSLASAVDYFMAFGRAVMEQRPGSAEGSREDETRQKSHDED